MMRRRRIAALPGACAALAVILYLTLDAARRGRLNPWQAVTVVFADGTTVRLERQHAHLYLAEYRLRYQVEQSGREPIRFAKDDPGGGFPQTIRLHAGESRRYIVLGGSIIDLETGGRPFYEEGKIEWSPIDDPRLPPLVEAFTVDKRMAASRSVPSDAAR